jgi:hypothetical protein
MTLHSAQVTLHSAEIGLLWRETIRIQMGYEEWVTPGAISRRSTKQNDRTPWPKESN